MSSDALFYTGVNMLQSYFELLELVQSGVITGLDSIDQVKGSSIDVRLGKTIQKEYDGHHIVSLAERNMVSAWTIDITEDGYYDLKPGEFILAHTMEKFNMPDNLSATFHLKSTCARMGIGHLLAVHIDPGFNNSVLTLEMHNVTRYHSIRLRAGDHIGQILFWSHKEVPPHASYRNNGRYNNDLTVSGVKP